MEKLRTDIEKNINSKTYRAWEKLEHESQMRFKAWGIEQSIYFAPTIAVMFVYFLFGLIQDMDLPYNQSFDFFSATFFYILIVTAAINLFLLKYFKPLFDDIMKKHSQDLSEDVYQKGAKFANTKEYNQTIEHFLKTEFEISKSSSTLETFKVPLQKLSHDDDKRFEVEPHDMKIPRISLATGLCIMGSPGRGKSMLINHIINQIPNNANTKTILIDVKGEFVEKFYNPLTDFILCPADLRSVKFELYKFIKTHVDAGVIADILIPDDKNTPDPHWTNAARAVMEGILVKAAKRKLSNKEIFAMVSDAKLLNELKNDEDIRNIVYNFLRGDVTEDALSRETASILSTLARKAKPLQYLKYADDLEGNDFIEFKSWLCDGKGGKLFLLATDNLSRVFSPLYGVITSYLISSILDGADNRDLNFYFILDELPRLGKALGENLEKALAVGRSKGIKIIMAMQSYSQIKKEFGEKEAESILDTTNSYVIFQNNIGAEFLEKYFGKTTVLRNDESFSFGMDSMADRVTVSRKEVKEALIDSAEISRLNIFEFYAKIEGCADVLKGRLAAEFIHSKNIPKYLENPKMTIEALEKEVRYIIKYIENNFINTTNVYERGLLNKPTVKIMM